MYKLKLSALTLFTLILLFFLHVYGMSNHWYMQFAYYDLITHFLGGVGLALSVFYVLHNTKYILWLTILAGIAWEIFEVYFNITGWPISSRAYQIDTTIDMVMDTLGAVAVVLAIRYHKKKTK